MRSFPVAFQYPCLVALFDLAPLGYFLSLGLKKNHCLSPVFNIDCPARSFFDLLAIDNSIFQTLTLASWKSRQTVNSQPKLSMQFCSTRNTKPKEVYNSPQTNALTIKIN